MVDFIETPQAPFRRSADRCHLLARFPIYDKIGNTSFYYLHFTPGNILSNDGLLPRHVPHVLQGFLLRRPLSLFVGERTKAILNLPLCRELVEHVHEYPNSRVVLHITTRQAATEESKQLMTDLYREHVRFACDLDCLNPMEKGWITKIHSFDYVFINYDSNYEASLQRLAVVRKLNPKLKLITAGINSRVLRNHLLAGPTDFLQCTYMHTHDFYKDRSVLMTCPYVFALIKEILQPYPDLENAIYKIVSHHPYMRSDLMKFVRLSDNSYPENIWDPGLMIRCCGVDKMRMWLAAAGLHGLMFISTLTGNPFIMNAAFEPVKIALLRARYAEQMLQGLGYDDRIQSLGFVYTPLSIERYWASTFNLNFAQHVLCYGFKHGLEPLFELLLVSIKALEQGDIARFAKAVKAARSNLADATRCFERALIWSNRAAAIMHAVNYSDYINTTADVDTDVLQRYDAYTS